MSSEERDLFSVPYEVIAHRAGNNVDAMSAAPSTADAIELDVHLCKGRLEVRHAKILWPTSLLWEKWHLVPRAHPVPLLEEILAAADPDVHLWLDLKGLDPRLAKKVRPLVAQRNPVTVSSKASWMLNVFEGTSVRRFRSVGNRFELLLLERHPSRVQVEGVVLHQRLLDAARVRRLARRSRLVFSWGAESIERAHQLLDDGVSGLILDNRDLMDRLSASSPEDLT